jgi:hypothetical protein
LQWTCGNPRRTAQCWGRVAHSRWAAERKSTDDQQFSFFSSRLCASRKTTGNSTRDSHDSHQEEAQTVIVWEREGATAPVGTGTACHRRESTSNGTSRDDIAGDVATRTNTTHGDTAGDDTAGDELAWASTARDSTATPRRAADS